MVVDGSWIGTVVDAVYRTVLLLFSLVFLLLQGSNECVVNECVVADLAEDAEGVEVTA